MCVYSEDFNPQYTLFSRIIHTIQNRVFHSNSEDKPSGAYLKSFEANLFNLPFAVVDNYSFPTFNIKKTKDAKKTPKN